MDGAALFWSGGKDCALALALSRARPTLVTFVPPEGGFRCHPLGIVERQSHGLGLPHLFPKVRPERWREDYLEAMRELRSRHGVARILTGDIPPAPDSPELQWLRETAAEAGLALEMPLAGYTNAERLEMIEMFGIDAIVTGVRKRWYRPGLLGRRLTRGLLAESGLLAEPEFDACGERGEYHTITCGWRGLRFHEPEPLAEAELDDLIVLDWPAPLLARE